MTLTQGSERPDRRHDGDIMQCQSRERTLSPEPQPTTRGWGKFCILVTLMYAIFWVAASYSLQAPFFPREAESKGATPTQYGFVMGIYELVVVLASPVYGKIMPRVSPKFLIIAGSLLGGTSCVVFGALDYVPAGRTYLALAFILRISEGFGAAAIMTSCFTIIASSFPDTVATSFSLMQTTFGIGLILGPTIGGALFQVGGFMLPFAVDGVFFLLGSIPLFFILPTIENIESQGSRNLLKFLLDGGLITFNIAVIAALFFLGFNIATLEPHLRQFHLPPIILGVVFIVIGTIYAITTPIWGKICDMGVNPLWICVLGYVTTCIGILFIGPVEFIPFEPSLATIICSLLVLGSGASAQVVAGFTGSLKSTLSRGFPDNMSTHSMVSALFSTACSTGAFIGPSIGGALLEHIGYRKATLVVFEIELFFLVLLVIYAVCSSSPMNRHVPNDPYEQDPLLPQPHIEATYVYSSL